MALPLLIPLAVGAGAALGVGSGVAENKSRKPIKDRNDARIEQMLAQERAGGLGLTAAEQRLMDQRLNAPVARAAEQSQSQFERLASGGAAGPQTAGGIQALRESTQTAKTAGAQQAAVQLLSAQQQAKAEQGAELERRLVLQAQIKQQNQAAIIDPLAEALSATGAIAGAPPGTLTASGAAGLPGGGVAAAAAPPTSDAGTIRSILEGRGFDAEEINAFLSQMSL